MSRYGTNNFGHYRGDQMSVAEQIRFAQGKDKERFTFMAQSLVDIIGQAGYETWVDETLPDNFTWAEACKLIEAEIEFYECSCTPDRDTPCAGCQHYFDTKGNRDE